MGLGTYIKKRNFNRTPEPRSGKSAGNGLRFVVQKHQATTLHYDFRLELNGVLKSWAVPKGPSMKAGVKRLAVMTEDHPYDYKDFEGIIPENNYGAGTVIIWDEGTYEPDEEVNGKSKQQKLLSRQLESGSLKFILHGEKLKGEFTLVRMKGRGDKSWLLIKKQDDFATKKDVTTDKKSVRSRKTIEQLSPEAGDHDGNPGKKKKPASKDDAGDPAPAASDGAGPQEGVQAGFPDFIPPMLATLTDAPFDDPDWEFEVKWDGYRATCYRNGDLTELKSRNNKSFDERFYPVHEAVKAWDIHGVVDGEIVVVRENGISSFNDLQNWHGEADGQLFYYVFDLLWLDGKDLTSLPLSERKALLEPLIPPAGLIRSGYSVRAEGKEFFKAAQKLGLEGIIAKKSDSRYIPGDRSRSWLKIKIQKRQEVVIGGYTQKPDTPKPFSSLLLGVFEGEKLRYVGKVGTGFSTAAQAEMLRSFKPLIRKTSPFSLIPDTGNASGFWSNQSGTEVVWLKPELVCEIHFSEITNEGLFRHPAFAAMRDDKPAKKVTMEKTVANPEKQANAGKASKRKEAQGPLLLNPVNRTQTLKIDNQTLKFTNLHKVFWSEEGYTKRDMLNYYHRMAPYILPYLKDRPESLNRFPNGIKGKNFFQKDVTGKVPEWAELYPYETEGENKNYLLANSEAALLYMVNLGSVEINPWFSTVRKPDYPDYCVLDLDPDKGNTFDQVIEVARVIHDLLEAMDVKSYCKTSGSTGLHVYIPLGARYTYEQSLLFARYIAGSAHQRLPDFTSVERMVANRRGKIYIDFLQNRPGATLASPYSLRPKPGATVSMPLRWEEVKPGLKMTDFTILNSVERVQKLGDIFAPVLETGIDLEEKIGAFS